MQERRLTNGVLARSTFIQCIARLMCVQQHKEQCVDYFQNVPFFENSILLVYIVKSRIPTVIEQNRLFDQTSTVSEFLRQKYVTLVDTSGDALIETRRALVGCSGENVNVQVTLRTTSSHDKLLKPLQFIDNMEIFVTLKTKGVAVVRMTLQ